LAVPSATTRAKRRRLSGAERRERILAGAMKVFAARGYQEASMSAIARAAGITPAVIYDHFSSKADLHIELLERQTEELLAFVAGALQAAPQDPAELMRAGVEAFFSYVEQHRFAWRMLFRDPPSDPDVAAAYRRVSRRATGAIAGFIEAAASDSLATYPDPGQTAEMFAQLMRASQQGLAAWWYEHRRVSRELIVETLLDFCWVGLERLAAGERRPVDAGKRRARRSARS
jgi:AcrR family transcriptional regulator